MNRSVKECSIKKYSYCNKLSEVLLFVLKFIERVTSMVFLDSTQLLKRHFNFFML